jgi:hypothetical protein
VDTYDNVALALLVSHLLLERSAKGVESGSAGGDVDIGEDTNCRTISVRAHIARKHKDVLHLSPASTWFLTDSSLKEVLERTALVRSSSLDELAPMNF